MRHLFFVSVALDFSAREDVKTAKHLISLTQKEGGRQQDVLIEVYSVISIIKVSIKFE